MTTLLLAALALTCLFIWQITERTNVYYADRCFADVTYADAVNQDLLFKGNITFEFNKKQTGVFNLSGNIDYQGYRYRLSRYVSFTYHNVHGNQYRMKNTTQEIMAHDNVPEETSKLVSKIFGLEGDYIVYLQKNNDNYITIANTLSPMLNCVIQK